MARTPEERADRLNQAQLRRHGKPMTYRGSLGKGEPIEARGILRKPEIVQSGAPGYFGDLEVDPAVIANPVKGDAVVWADGVEYVVARVVVVPYGLTTLAIHRRLNA